MFIEAHPDGPEHLNLDPEDIAELALECGEIGVHSFHRVARACPADVVARSGPAFCELGAVLGLAHGKPLGDDFPRIATEGRRLDGPAAVAYARRARGERRRPSFGWDSLTPTELEVVRLAAAGLTNPAIGERLFISRGTVKTHLLHIFAKLGVHTRAELAAAAIRRGLG